VDCYACASQTTPPAYKKTFLKFRTAAFIPILENARQSEALPFPLF
jgi:hypothetical protein